MGQKLLTQTAPAAASASTEELYSVETRSLAVDFGRSDIYDKIEESLAGLEVGVLGEEPFWNSQQSCFHPLHNLQTGRRKDGRDKDVRLSVWRLKSKIRMIKVKMWKCLWVELSSHWSLSLTLQ